MTGTLFGLPVRYHAIRIHAKPSTAVSVLTFALQDPVLIPIDSAMLFSEKPEIQSEFAFLFS